MIGQVNQTGISRDQLRLRAHRAAAELRSKGTIEDPVAKDVGWGIQRLDSFDTTLGSYPQGSLQDLKHFADKKSEDGDRAHRKGLTGVFLAAAAMSGLALAAPLLGPAALAVSAGVTLGAGAISALQGLSGAQTFNQAEQTAADLEQWEQSYKLGLQLP